MIYILKEVFSIEINKKVPFTFLRCQIFDRFLIFCYKLFKNIFCNCITLNLLSNWYKSGRHVVEYAKTHLRICQLARTDSSFTIICWSYSEFHGSSAK